ncbi:MAG TPA: bifunctional demethylmenaquinone methyltransferase/2-methoxy-6-polyprenyl-1,4-benzoquinol methylase UbiE [Pyrinomonadaceae bacterium]|jgi:demethylmenaquinone methyltransferase/2-methoxy-6-polyprenyl-1,4-benzoquinol methylase|nr:bifunctional demethylmenaquinone methyltransferase/2-methoxy-6-polyprenyl-1,4-benzoquinol methylase UbiE [Pyrinomonadaceae bacterium]
MGLTEIGQKTTEAHARRVREMFAKIAPRYDLLNHILSVNIDKRWRRRVVAKLKPLLIKDARVLDVGCGTGDLSIELFENTATQVTGIDFCAPMLKLAQAKAPQLQFIEGDALKLPFAEASFDGLTIGFALRNLADVERGLRELLRVLKPNGAIAILEFSHPVNPVRASLVGFYNWRLLPWIGGLVSGSRGAYEYLPDSISKFPNQDTLASLMCDVGFADVRFENLSGGIAALHMGRRE